MRFDTLPKFLQRDIKRLYEGGATPYFIALNLEHFGVTKRRIEDWAIKFNWDRSKSKKLTRKEMLDILSYSFINLDKEALKKLLDKKHILKQYKILPNEYLNEDKKLSLADLQHFTEKLKKKIEQKESNKINRYITNIHTKKDRVKHEFIKRYHKDTINNGTANDRILLKRETTKDEFLDRAKLKKELEEAKEKDKKEVIEKDSLSGVILDDEETSKIIYMIIQHILMGSRIDSIKKGLRDKYKFNNKRCVELINLAKEELISQLETNAMYAVAFHREARMLLYKKMFNNEDYRGALEALKDLAKIDGIYSSENSGTPLPILDQKEKNTITLEMPEEYQELFKVVDNEA